MRRLVQLRLFKQGFTRDVNSKLCNPNEKHFDRLSFKLLLGKRDLPLNSLSVALEELDKELILVEEAASKFQQNSRGQDLLKIIKAAPYEDDVTKLKYKALKPVMWQEKNYTGL